MMVTDVQQFVNSVFNLCVTKEQDCFEELIGLLCLLLMTGNIWVPEV